MTDGGSAKEARLFEKAGLLEGRFFPDAAQIDPETGKKPDFSCFSLFFPAFPR